MQRFPVTQNLYESLRSLRRPQALSLLRRICQQAEKIIVYLLLLLRDWMDIGKLVREIFEGCRRYHENENEKEEAGYSSSSGQQKQTEERRFVSGRKVIENESFSASESLSRDSPGLEDFGIPPEDTLLLDLWCLMFASPYFRRVWILQEVALGRNLWFWTGNAECDAEAL
ncbi:hypothetical protein F4680DRAFT_464579 [Xylaria scruposa]|nr:hypothetical protein F4680DRAFT_464579 [Xylaria scruposa]